MDEKQSPISADMQTALARNPWKLALPLGVGTMNWGTTWLDKKIAGYIMPNNVVDAIVQRAAGAGITFFDTAEGYGGGSSESRLRTALDRLHQTPATANTSNLCLATKFLPTLWRWSEQSFIDALDASNKRLGISCCEVYFIHSPVHPLKLETWVRAAAVAVKQGKMKYLGLSNFNADQVRRACSLARTLGLVVVANQILFNLMVYGSKELQRTLVECDKWGVKIIAYSPLGQGLLNKAAMNEEKAKSVRFLRMAGLSYDRITPIREEVKRIADAHGKSMTHVCLAWVWAKQAIPLVGIRSVEQLDDVLQAVGLKLTADEVALLDSKSLDRHTFEKPRWRRSLFIVFISFLMLAYRVSAIFAV